MAKEPVFVSGDVLAAALERMCVIMKDEVEKDPELAYEVASGVVGGMKIVP
jgi:hypothetical protein